MRNYESSSIPKEKKLLEQVSDAIRAKHYSLPTEKTYIDGIRRFILYHKRHKDVKTTMSYIHVLQRGGLAVKSPLDV